MGREYTEVEKPFLDQLKNIGWEVVELDDNTKHDPTKSFRESFKEIILEPKFREAVKRIKYNLFNIITTGETAKYGSLTAQKEHYLEWKDPYPYKLSDIKTDIRRVNSQNILIQGMLTKQNLIDIIHNFILFKTENEKLIKIVPRYQQFRAVNKLIKRLKDNSLPNDKKGGIIWHTQGSGKSLTMMYIIRKAYHDDFLRQFKIV